MKKSALSTVFFVVLIDLIGFGIVLPHLAFYADRMGASAITVGLLYSVYSIAQLVFSPIWGALSDRIGRRPVMMISTLGASASYLLFAFSGSLAMFFVARFLAGVMAGNISTAQAYVADVTTPENRSKGMGMIGAAFGIGFVLGPALGALIGRWSGGDGVASHAPLGWFAASLSLTSFFLVLFCLPESLKPGAASDSKRVEKMSVFTPVFWRSTLTSGLTPLFPWLLLSVFLLSLGQASLYGAFPLFCSERLGLSSGRVGILYVVMGMIAVLIQGGMIRPLEKKFGEAPLFASGCALFVAGLAAIPFAVSGRLILWPLAVMSVGGSLCGPVLTSLVSKQSKPDAYGRTMGLSQGLSALGRAIGPAWGGWLFGMQFRLPFVVTAGVAVLTLVTAAKLFSRKR
jgi:multidrug resistance protein